MNLNKTYACYNINKNERLSSSSGAVFSSLARKIINCNGVVYGVAMSKDCYSANFIGITDVNELYRLRGSKYFQAKVGNAYKEVRDNLNEGKQVLFSGTGCQINGLKKFLGKEYDNLLCIDVICHGVPSPALWKKYAVYQEKKNGGKLEYINFRCKDDSWIDFGMKEVMKDLPSGNLKKYYISKNEDSFMQMFLKDYSLRPSCYECVAKKYRMSDITIADFWGINDVAPDMNDGNGTSLVLIRTDKGLNAFKTIFVDLKIKEVVYEDGVKRNPAEYKSCVRPSERDTFFDDMNSMVFEELEKKYASPTKMTFNRRMKRKIKNTIKLVLRKLGGRKNHISMMRNTD